MKIQPRYWLMQISQKKKKAQIMSGDIEKIQSAVGIQAVCFVLTHSEI